jgi:hypothetical protein
MRHIFPFHLTYFRVFRVQNTKMRKHNAHFRIVTFSYCCIFAFLHCYFFALLHFCFSHPLILSRSSENTTWCKPATITVYTITEFSLHCHICELMSDFDNTFSLYILVCLLLRRTDTIWVI